MDKKAVVNKVSTISIVTNAVLSAFKLLAGILAHSSAMISDSVHSLSDVISTIAVIIGVNLSERASDESHQYGHERLESIFSILLSVMLAITGVGIGYTGIQSIISVIGGESIKTPEILALIAAGVSIIVKELMYHYTIHAAKKVGSTALKADAWHHRSDALSSIGALIGIGGAMLGFPICDPIASIIICLFIIKTAYDIFMEATNQLVDHSCNEELEKQIESVIMSQNGVMNIDVLHTRLFGSKIFVDVELSADEKLTFREAHDIAEHVHHAIEDEFPNVKHCMVHANPKKNENEA